MVDLLPGQEASLEALRLEMAPGTSEGGVDFCEPLGVPRKPPGSL